MAGLDILGHVVDDGDDRVAVGHFVADELAGRGEHDFDHGVLDGGLEMIPELLTHHLAQIVELLMLAKRIDIIQSSFRVRLRPLKEQVVARHGIAEEYVDYAIAIRIGVLMNILIQWIENGKRHAPDELADTLGAMIGKMVTLDQLL